MKQGAGKAKGSAFERTVCKQLSLWVSRGKQEDLFWRSAMSGGRATVARRRGVTLARQAGDITATAPEGHVLTDQFYIECKAYKRLAIDRLLVGSGTLHNFWVIATREARAHRRTPLMIVRENNFPVLVLAPPGQLEPCMQRACGPVATLPGLVLYKFDAVLKTKFVRKG